MNAALAQLDTRLTPEVRVRSWSRGREEVPRWPANAHETVEIAWVEAGDLSYVIDRETTVVPAGTAIVVPPEVEHRTAIAPGTRAGSIHLAPELLSGVARAAGVRAPSRASAIGANEALIPLARCLLEEARSRDLGRGLAAESLAEAIAVRVLRAAGAGSVDPEGSPAGPAKDPRIARAAEHIEHALEGTISVEELAQTAHMSRFHFSRAFKRELGLSPHQYLMKARVLRAAAMLRTGRHSVTEAALTVGFADLGRFGRMFRRWVGCAPSEMKSARSADRSARFAERARA